MNINEMGGGLPERVSSDNRKINPPHIRLDASQSLPELSSGKIDRIQHTRDPEVIRLVQTLNQSPEIRLDKTSEVTQRIVSGEYLTRQVAEQTAGAMLNQ